MITLQRNKQKMKYSLQGEEVPIYKRDNDGNIKYRHYIDADGNIIYYLDDDGNQIPIETGETEIQYTTPVPFSASISNKLSEVLLKDFGIDDSTSFSQIVYAKGKLPLVVGAVIWKKSDVGYKDSGKTIVDEKTADYTVKGVADEGLDTDLFLLQRIVK